MEKSSITESQTPSPTSTKPSLPWQTRFQISILSAVTDISRRSDGTINRRLLKFLDFKIPPNPTKPINQIISSDITVDASRDLWFRLFTPTTPSPATSLPVIVFLHGGGFVFLSAASKAYDAVCRKLALNLQAIVISVNYRLAPEYLFPSQYDDGIEILKFLNENVAVLPKNSDLTKCFLAGDSAGANIAHHVAVRFCQEKFKILKLIGLISIQPFFGGVDRTESETRLSTAPLVSVSRTDWMWKVYLPEGCHRDHAAVNVSGPNAVDISGLKDFPATVVVIGGFDPLQDWQRKYYEWLRKSGKEAELLEFPNSIHAFYIFPELPESSELIQHLKTFVSHCCSKL